MAERKRTFDWSRLRPRASEPPTVPPTPPVQEVVAPELPAVAGDRQRDASVTSIPLRVNDLKQYAYCPRIVFYQYAMPVQHKATFKMDHGKAIEPRLEQLEQRRTLREYGLAEGMRE